ncbi:MAG TPA: polysaccharide deacetylase [Blastocatellia bacterium]|nr:polysaccharide deacetylase [Blastocatellia bacterium]
MKEVIAGLRPVCEQLQADRRRVRIFFRDDDVDEDEATLHRLLRIFLRHEAPVNLEIIPGRLTKSAARLLRQYRDFRPRLIGLNQHGWQHVNHEPAGRKCEFGPSRSFDEQIKDISQGRAVLEAVFETAFFPAFTPPWNRCTNETAQALDELGFQVLSKDQCRLPAANYRFQEIPVTLDLYRWRQGPVMKAPAEIISDLSRQMREADRIGILLHHKVMDETAFEFLDLLTSELRAQSPVSLELFQSLLQG